MASTRYARLCFALPAILLGQTIPVRIPVVQGSVPSTAADSLDARADAFRTQIAAKASVAEGSFAIFEADDCAEFEHCWANNPTSPYGSFFVPLDPDEPDPDPENRGPGTPQSRTFFRLRPEEALVYIGVTPPPSPYFSFTPYVFSRFDPDAQGSPPYDDRVEVYASMGDSLNNLAIRTSAAAEEDPFGKETVVIFTSDRGSDAMVRSALQAAGFPLDRVNTIVLPHFKADGFTPHLRMGLENEDDLFNVLVRIANPDALAPGSAIRAWLDNPGGRVFRVRPLHPTSLDPFPIPAQRTPGNGINEDPLPLQTLLRGIRRYYRGASMEVQTGFPSVHEDGDRCLDRMVPCFADCRDTPYMGRPLKLGPPPEAVIVAGNNHERSGKASYVNVTVTRLSDTTAFSSVVMRDLQGSSRVYVPAGGNADAVWQVKFSRRCDGEPYCFEITEEQVPLDAYLMVIVRAYLDPATKTSPKAKPARDTEIVFPKIITLHPPPPRPIPPR